ncbi:hypothetical protein [Marinactinospora rubrisoli]|uniref:Uncharacterized protein n=1 Tax=Marinactinospora rubrisoli TaxID=2715399 RepID=A0ABW2KQF0_9ACTN
MNPDRVARWAALIGDTELAAHPDDPAAHRRAVIAWLEKTGLSPDLVNDPNLPDDPVTRAQWAAHRDVTPERVSQWQRDGTIPPPAIRHAPARAGAGPRGNFHIHSLAVLEASPAAIRPGPTPPDPGVFSPGERVGVSEFARRTGRDRSTIAHALRTHADRAPQRDDRKHYDARELAAFVAGLPGRRGPGRRKREADE